MTDRKLLWGAAAIAAFLIIGSFVFIPPPERDRSWVPSSYSSGDRGAKAAYLLLEQSGYSVARWEESPAGLLNASEPSVLVLAQPLLPASAQEKRWLRQYIENGNRVLFCGGSLENYFPDVKLHQIEADDVEPSDFKALLPSRFSVDAPVVHMTRTADWTSSLPSHLVLYGDAQGAVVTVWPMGKGEVIWWASAEPLTNDGISKAGNLALFLDSLSSHNGGSKPVVYWDEYYHGQQGSLWSYVVRTPLRWGAWQLILLIALLLLTYSRQAATIWRADPEPRLSPLEFVQTLGGLYERAKVSSVPVSIAYRDLRLQLSRRLGLRSDATDEDLARAAQRRLGWDETMLQAVLTRAQGGAMNAASGLEIVKELDRFRKKLESPLGKGKE